MVLQYSLLDLIVIELLLEPFCNNNSNNINDINDINDNIPPLWNRR